MSRGKVELPDVVAAGLHGEVARLVAVIGELEPAVRPALDHPSAVFARIAAEPLRRQLLRRRPSRARGRSSVSGIPSDSR